MKNLILGIALLVALVGCSEKKPEVGTTPEKPSAAAISAGKAVAERDCKGCHGLDGKGTAPGIPNLAGQRERYLAASVKEYKDGTRVHAALKDMMGNINLADTASVVVYYASLPPVPAAAVQDVQHSSPYQEGKVLAAACASCHGEDGNSKTPGTPTLAGQQPHYLVTAIREYHQGDRIAATMKSMLRGTNNLELEKLAVYFGSQTPVQRAAPPFGDPAAGEPATAMCGGCHGARGVSNDGATPSLAGQDPQYLVKAINSYRKDRLNWSMQRYVAGLSNTDIVNIAAFYAIQTPKAADVVPSSIKELADKCNRCHAVETTTAMAAPKMDGQDKDYLVMALRAYRDGRRQSTMMHSMSFGYNNAMIESIASWYASQPAK